MFSKGSSKLDGSILPPECSIWILRILHFPSFIVRSSVELLLVSSPSITLSAAFDSLAYPASPNYTPLCGVVTIPG